MFWAQPSELGIIRSLLQLPAHNLGVHLGFRRSVLTFYSSGTTLLQLVAFCCGGGKYVIDFDSFFPAPSNELQQMFNEAWPLLDADKSKVFDVKRNSFVCGNHILKEFRFTFVASLKHGNATKVKRNSHNMFEEALF